MEEVNTIEIKLFKSFENVNWWNLCFSSPDLKTIWNGDDVNWSEPILVLQ